MIFSVFQLICIITLSMALGAVLIILFACIAVGSDYSRKIDNADHRKQRGRTAPNDSED